MCFLLRVVWPYGTGWSFGLPVGCSNYQLLYQGEAVDRIVVRLDAVVASYCTTRKRSTGWSTGVVSNVLQDLFQGWFEARFVQLFKVDFMA